MLEVKAWLETTGMKVAEERFKSPPQLPYIIFTDDSKIDGADSKNCLVDRDISIELYSEKINREAESKIETLLNEKAIKFKKNRTWIDNENFFQIVYDFNLYEKL